MADIDINKLFSQYQAQVLNRAVGLLGLPSIMVAVEKFAEHFREKYQVESLVLEIVRDKILPKIRSNMENIKEYLVSEIENSEVYKKLFESDWRGQLGFSSDAEIEELIKAIRDSSEISERDIKNGWEVELNFLNEQIVAIKTQAQGRSGSWAIEVEYGVFNENFWYKKAPGRGRSEEGVMIGAGGKSRPWHFEATLFMISTIRANKDKIKTMALEGISIS